MYKKHFFVLTFLANIFLANTIFAQNLFDINSVKDIRVTFAYKDWDKKLDSLKKLGNEFRLIGKVTVDGVTYDSCGIRYKGNSSYNSVRNLETPKLPFNIKSNEVKKKQKFANSYNTLKLSNVFRDPSFLREALAYEIFRKYMPASRATYVRLFVNEKQIGFYNSVEPVDDAFLSHFFGSEKGLLVKCDPDWHSEEIKKCPLNDKASLTYLGDDPTCYLPFYEMKNAEKAPDFVKFIKTLNKEPQNLESVLNIDQCLWMHALNNSMVNLDSYLGKLSHNYYMYRDTFNVWQPIIWDLNLCFGSSKSINAGSDLTLEELQKLNPMLHETNPLKPLISQLLKNPYYTKVYISHIRQILADNIDNSFYEKRAKELQSNIKIPFMNDQFKYYQDKDLEKSIKATVGEKSKIPGLVELMSARAKFLKKNAALESLPPSVSDVKITAREKYAKENITIFKIQAKVDKFPKKVKIMYRANKDNPWMEAQMNDDGKSSDGTEGDKIFGVVIDPKGSYDSLEYYFVVENKEAIGFFPANYWNGAATVSLTQLNK